MTSVKVAVRVRPFNDREKKANSRTIIRMEDSDTYITHPVSDPKPSRLSKMANLIQMGFILLSD